MTKTYDEETGEVEQKVIKPAKSFATFLTTLEDGNFNDVLSDELRDLSEAIYLQSANYGGKPKGKITITIDLQENDGIFDIRSNYSVKKPIIPRQRSIAWTDENHNLVPSNPKQKDMFKDVNSLKIKDVN